MSLPEPSPKSIALVTGASSGIGEQFARQLSAMGHRVALVARREDRLRELAQELGGEERAVVVAADLAEAADRNRVADRLQELGAEVDILVNNAGYGIYKAFAADGRDAELQQVRLLVEAVVDLMARYLPGMRSRGRGAIINMSSTAAFQALPYNAGYAAAKAHVLMLSEAVHAEVEDAGVTVTAVCPGPVPSGFQEASDADYFAQKLPKFTFVEPERVARDALRAAARGQISVIPGGPQVRAAFGPNRKLPRWLVLPVSKRLMARS
ncbi:MAG TPA: SDR family oxidoreductase [Solirubrobacteraceae bacterium]|nr:SDR family oxidoreductase [Solirubrobacteraceae bacterium]